MKTVSGLLLTTAFVVTVATGASAYSFNPPDASVHLHGKMTFTPNEGGSPFTCTVTMDLKTKRRKIYAVKFPTGSCNVRFSDLPWTVAILNANSGEIEINGFVSSNGNCVQTATTFQDNVSGIWTLPTGQCFSGTFRSSPPTTIVP
jgi:hypothetical protein